MNKIRHSGLFPRALQVQRYQTQNSRALRIFCTGRTRRDVLTYSTLFQSCLINILKICTRSLYTHVKVKHMHNSSQYWKIFMTLTDQVDDSGTKAAIRCLCVNNGQIGKLECKLCFIPYCTSVTVRSYFLGILYWKGSVQVYVIKEIEMHCSSQSKPCMFIRIHLGPLLIQNFHGTFLPTHKDVSFSISCQSYANHIIALSFCLIYI